MMLLECLSSRRAGRVSYPSTESEELVEIGNAEMLKGKAPSALAQGLPPLIV